MTKCNKRKCNKHNCWVPPFITPRQNTNLSWGLNNNGQLGNGNNNNPNIPGYIDTSGVLNNKTIVKISAGSGSHTLVLTAEGNVYAWGDNFYGQLGNGTNIGSNIPIGPVQGILTNKKIVDISAGAGFSLVLDSEGKVYTWGDNFDGQLGNGNNITSNIPVAVDMSGVLNGKIIKQISAGGFHSMVLDTEGRVYTWGLNNTGQLGNSNNISSNIPVEVDTSGVLDGKTVKEISGGNSYSMALDTEGKVYTWGYNSFGQLGNGNNITSNIPVAVDTSGVLNGKTIKQISAGGFHSMALDTDGKVYSWGANFDGQLGNGNNIDSNIPVAVDTSGVLNSKEIKQISAGTIHNLILDVEGKVYTWGSNFAGQLGNGNNTDSNVPVVTVKISNIPVRQISAGRNFSLAI